MNAFVTFFPNSSNVHLVKGVGQIPYWIGVKTGKSSRLISTQIDMEGGYLSAVPGLQIDKIQFLLANELLTGVAYIAKNARSIDCLNLYHFRKQTYIWSKCYKVFNPKGKLYVKLDAGYKTIELLKNDLKKRKLFNKLTNICDLVSVETRTAQTDFRSITNKRIEYIPIGFEKSIVCETSTSFRNVFLTVGRIGAPEKNDDVLLDAFVNIYKRCDWNLRLVGKIEPDFITYYDAIVRMHPDIEERIELVGEVIDRSILAQEYASAKVFVLPSEYESFSTAALEALANGCYLVLSDAVTSAVELTKGCSFGAIVSTGSSESLSEAMLSCTKNEYTVATRKTISDYAKKNYSWESIVDNIINFLEV